MAETNENGFLMVADAPPVPADHTASKLGIPEFGNLITKSQFYLRSNRGVAGDDPAARWVRHWQDGIHIM